MLDGATRTAVTGNTFAGRHDVVETNGASDNTLSPNRVQ